MNGDLAEGVLPELLREIYVGRRNGTLRLVRGQERQSLCFRHGHIVNAHTNVLEERLGEMLVRRGVPPAGGPPPAPGDRGGGEPGGELTLKLSTGELILEAVQAVRDPDVVRYALGDMDRVLTLSSDP